MKRFKFLLCLLIGVGFRQFSIAQVGIGTTTPNASSILDITTTTKGMLAPRMTLAQKTAISSPATGLLIFQTDGASGFWFYTGSAWIPVLANNNGWTTTGNTGTTAGTNFIGTTDAVDVVTKSNNTEVFRATSTGRLGVGISSPTGVLHLKAGTTAASSAPLKFTSGSNLTTLENGAVEYDGTHLYITIGSTRYQLDQQNTLKATYQGTPADPTSTTNTTGVMMGLAGSITPTVTGKLLITISGDMKNGSNNGNSVTHIRYGTGTAPANGNALTGTVGGSLINMTAAAANQRVPFSCNVIVTLTVGTTYWIDLGLKAASGTAFVQNISISVVEI